MSFDPRFGPIDNPDFRDIYNYFSDNPQLPCSCSVRGRGTEYEELTLQTKLVKIQKDTKPTSFGEDTMITLLEGEQRRNGYVKTSGVDAPTYAIFMNKAATLQPHHVKTAVRQIKSGMTLQEVEAIFDKVLLENK